MAKQILNIGAAPNDGNGDPLRDAMDKVNDNFNELYTALGGNTVSTIVSNGLIDYTGANKLTFLFTDISDLPAASSYHGMFAHAHNQGAAYFAHAGSWIELANKSELSNITIGSLIDVDTTSSAPTDGQVLKWDNAGSKWVPADDSNDGSVALTDLSVTVASAGTANLAYNANTGAFTYTPPDLSGYQLTSNAFDGDYNSLTNKPTIPSALTDLGISDGTTGQVLKTDGAGNFTFGTITTGSSYGDSDVDTHLNTSSATANQILSWNGSDYAWVADQTSAGGTDTVIAPFAFANVETTSNGSATGISWSNWNSGNASLDFTFDNAQANTQYTVVTDSETFDDYFVGISNKTTTGFTASFYDDSQSRTPSNFSPFTIIVYAETPTATITGSNISNASIGALNDVSISSATTGQVLKYNGSSWVNDTDAGSSVTNMASLTDVDSVDTVASGDFLLFDGSSSEYKFVAFEAEVNGLIDNRTGSSGHISTQSQYAGIITTYPADPTNTDNHVLGNNGTPSVHNASTAWYYGDVVSDPTNPTTTVVLDIDSGILTGDVIGNITSTGTSTFSGTVDFSASSNVDFTGATVSGLPNDTWATLGDKDGPAGPSKIALGTNAGNINQGANSIAIGAQAGVTNQAATSIVINATGIVLDNPIPESFVVKPVRGLVTAQALYYDVATGEVTYGDAFDGAFGSLSGTPTTIAGYGITDAFDGAFGSLSGTPTTLAGYGITDAFDGAFGSLSGTPTTLAGYGITDAANTGSDTTFTANVLFDTGVQEKFATLTGSTGITVMDCDNGQVFYLTGAAGDITANFTNLGLTAEYGTNVTVIINQGATPYEVTAVQIGGVAQTINWQGGSAPIGNANGIDSFSFTILNDGGTYVVLGQMVDFT